MINLLVRVAIFACLKLAFLWIFGSERKKCGHVPQVGDEDPYLIEDPDGRIQVSSLLSEGPLPKRTGLTWVDLSEPS